MHDAGKEIALFRYTVIAPLTSLDGRSRGQLKAAIRDLASRPHPHPTKGPVLVGKGTIEEWLYKWKHEGLDGLGPCPRQDRGQPRRIDDEVQDFIEELAKDRLTLSGVGLLAEVEAHFGKERTPSLSTLYRLLDAKGLKNRGEPARRDHRAFEFDLAGDCWQGDVMYGPALCTKEGKRKHTYLIAILDDATRLICHAQFYSTQDLRCLKDCLKQALLKRGVPRRFYFDNGKIFRSRLMLYLAARLGVQMIHTRPYKPQGRAKLERWFRTVRMNFLSRVDTTRIESLEALNRLLFAWVEGEYHIRPHKGLEGETPLDRWMRLSGGLRPLPADVNLDQLFLAQCTRRIAKDGTFRIAGRRFEAGPAHIGKKLTIRFDSFDLRRVWMVTPEENLIDAYPVDLEGNRKMRREPSPEEPKRKRGLMPLRSLEQLAGQQESGDEREGDGKEQIEVTP